MFEWKTNRGHYEFSDSMPPSRLLQAVWITETLKGIKKRGTGEKKIQRLYTSDIQLSLYNLSQRNGTEINEL